MGQERSFLRSRGSRGLSKGPAERGGAIPRYRSFCDRDSRHRNCGSDERVPRQNERDWNEEEDMKRRSFFGAFAAASLGVVVEGSLAEFARAHNSATALASLSGQGSRRSEFPQNSTIILVHGAWADGSCWRNVILPLERRGFRVICAPIPLTSLTNDATALSWALEKTSGPVVLVGHAYSGAVIAAVRNDRVKSLVYIAALAPDEGET